MKREYVPLHIKTREEFADFPTEVLSIDKPWNYRLAGGCVGLFVKPLIFLLGKGEAMRFLCSGEKEELKELLSIIGDQSEWEKLNKFQQLEARKKASILADRFTVSMLFSFRK